jgi:hypothetical protein
MSLCIHISDLIFNLKIKLVMSCQLIALVISNIHLSQSFLVMLVIYFNHICVKNDLFFLLHPIWSIV